MLVDITPRGRNDDGRLRRLAQGVWQFRSWTPEHAVVEKLKDNYSFEGPDYPEGATPEERGELLRAWFVEDNAKRDARYAVYLDKYKIEVVGEYEEDLPPVAEGVRRQIGINDHYGVCDSPEQLLAYLPHLADDPELYMVAMVEIRREHQSDWGGWRWHKWGPYIGTQNPQHEYLYDEKHIDSVFTYHVYRVMMGADEVLANSGYTFKPGSDGESIIVKYEKGDDMERVGLFYAREDAIEGCYTHNANVVDDLEIAKLKKEGYKIEPAIDGNPYFNLTGFGTWFGGFPTKREAIIYARGDLRKRNAAKKVPG